MWGLGGMAALACIVGTSALWLGMGTVPVGPASAQGTTAQGTAAQTDSAYAVIDAAGGVMTFGGAGYEGDTLGLTLHEPIVGGAADPWAGGGYWLVASDGGVFTFGGAPFEGSTGGMVLN